MTHRLATSCYLGAAILVAAAGIFEVIDPTTMIVLIVVLTGCIPDCRRACFGGRRA